jgi:hypothetical protein
MKPMARPPGPFAVVIAVLLASSCASAGRAGAGQGDFYADFTGLCGRVFEGRLLAGDERDRDFRDNPLVLSIAPCPSDVVEMAFAVGDDRSRTWRLTSSDGALSFVHFHRLADGSEDVLSGYGGRSASPPAARRQSFPADEATVALFRKEGLLPSVDNVWSLELEGEGFVYELARPGRLVRVLFRPAPPQ